MYITPLRWSGGGNKKKFSLLPKEGPRLPPLAALGWIIAWKRAVYYDNFKL